MLQTATRPPSSAPKARQAAEPAFILRRAKFAEEGFDDIDGLVRRIHRLRAGRSIGVFARMLPPVRLETADRPAVEVRIADEGGRQELIGFVLMAGADRAYRLRRALAVHAADLGDEDEGGEP